MRYLETTLTKEEKKELENKGLYCYDLRSDDDGRNIATIEKKVLVNNCGNLITAEEIVFQKRVPDDDYIDYEEFCNNNEYYNGTIEEFVKEKIKHEVL